MKKSDKLEYVKGVGFVYNGSNIKCLPLNQVYLLLEKLRKEEVQFE